MTRRFLATKTSVFWLVTVVAALGGVALVHASLPNGTPARPVPQDLWGDLEPTDDPDQALPDNRDTTGYNEFGGTPYWEVPWWMSIDIENGLIFTIGSQSLQIWDPTGNVKAGGTQESPVLVSSTLRREILQFVTGEVATGWPMRDLDLPPGNDSVAAVAGAEMGLTVWDTSNKADPVNVYQYPGEGLEVYATTLGGRPYAFMATSDHGLLGFDLKRALQSGSCLDNSSGTACSGVYKGPVGDLGAASYVDGTGNYLAATSGRGVKIWDVSQYPLATLKLDALKDDTVRGLALWRDVDSSAHYLALVSGVFKPGVGFVYEGRIYDVSCITSSNGCNGVGALLKTITLGTNQGPRSFVTFSRSGPSAFVYFGTDNRTGGGPQREFLVDVTEPTQAHDITPQGTFSPDGKPLDYWSWYYEGNNGPNDINGFNSVGPRRGKFLGEYFYRAAWSIFDIHRRAGGLPPQAEFDWASREPDPTQIYPGSEVDFFDRSTGQPTAWSWFFQNGSPMQSSAQDPKGVTFNVNGPFPVTTLVTLTASNQVGASDPPKTKELTILDPVPSVTGVSSNVQSAVLCQPITFEIDESTGRSPLTYTWEVLDLLNSGATIFGPVALTEDPKRFVWDTETLLIQQVPPGGGTYRAQVTVSNDDGSASAQSPDVLIEPLPSLPDDGFGPPTNDDFISSTVQFHVSASGATEWNWDFGDGTTSGWLSDPIDGPNPTHTYQEVGTYEVTVQIRNCTTDTPVVSAPLSVDIVNIVQLHAEFKALGLKVTPVVGGHVLTAELNKPIEFEDLSTGAEQYFYDWEGNGTFEVGPLDAPETSHTYRQVGNFTPRLKVTRGESEEDVFTHATISVGGGSTPNPDPDPVPTINVSGSKGIAAPGDPVTFTASASNCTPVADGWSWSTTRGQIDGPASGNQIVVSWSSTGSKSVTAKNSGCGTAIGSTRVTITDSSTPPPPPDDGGELKASFTFSPQNPAPGDPVTFDASSSTGDPDSYAWNFGEGQKSEGTQTPTIEHTFSEPGTYQVSLRVSRPGGCTNFGICQSPPVTKSVVVSGTPVSPDEPMTHCEDDPDALCLLEDRFKVTVEWMDPRTGDTGIGKPLTADPLPTQDATGFFWFFNPNSVDLIVKMLDGVSVNGAVWFFSGGLSDVEYTITVEDRGTDPPTIRVYENVAGNICGLADTGAFPMDGGEDSENQSFGDISGQGAATHNLGGGGDEGDDTTGDDTAGDDTSGDDEQPTSPQPAACQPGPETLCLLDDRFEIQVDWRNPRPPFDSGTGRAIQGTRETGYFWFFSPSNVELVLKMIDARALPSEQGGGHFWVFYGALSDVEYDITVRDTVTDAVKTYSNEGGNICGQADTQAFHD